MSSSEKKFPQFDTHCQTDLTELVSEEKTSHVAESFEEQANNWSEQSSENCFKTWVDANSEANRADRLAELGVPIDGHEAARTPKPDFRQSLTFDDDYSWFMRLRATVGASWFMLPGLFLLAMIGLSSKLPQHKDLIPSLQDTFSDGIQIWLQSLGLRHAGNIDEVMFVLPWAILACTVTTALIAYVTSRSRARRIDWTDTHLLLEHSGPVSMAVKWAAVRAVDQKLQWELFHGKQPLFVLTTKSGLEFRLRIADITQQHNIGEFFSMIKTNAPEAKLNVSSDLASGNSYTELWLKYFSTPAERSKTGLLVKDATLDGGRYQIMGTVGGGGQGTAYLAVVQATQSSNVNLRSSLLSTLQELNREEATEAAAASGLNTTTRETDLESQIKADGVAQHIVEPNLLELRKSSEVVLKEYVLPVHRGHLTAERTAERLRTEAAILQELHHDQIVRLLDAFIEDYRGYLVLEFVKGETLKSIVENTGPLSEEQVIELAIQVCSVLAYLHERTPQVLHRDITPDNLMLQEDGTIKVVDFNVACQVDSSATSTVVGKHAYLPAEQFRGKAVAQSDVYALGATMFFLLTGQDPEPITQSFPKSFNDKVSEELNSIVAHATANAVGQRCSSSIELRESLEALKQSQIRAGRDVAS